MGQQNERLAFTVTWQVREGQIAAAADIVARFAPLARAEPGLEHLSIGQCATDPSRFLFFEIFKDATAFAVHQETAHFRTMILEQALPLLDKRERTQYALV
jgi:quinol monooxygenase YgiN